MNPRDERDRRFMPDDYERWRGSIDQQVRELDNRAEKILEVMERVQIDIRDILKWRYMIVGAITVISIIVPAIITLLVNYLVKQ